MIFVLIKQAVQSLFGNPARSFLTMLGIIIGISSVVMFMALGEGLRSDIKKEITSLGSNLLFIVPGEFKPGSGMQISSNIASGDILEPEDVTNIGELPEVEEVGSMMLVGGTLRKDTQTAPAAVLMASEQNFLDIFTTLSVKEGRFFTAAENTKKARVIALGETVAEQLFPNGDAIGNTVAIGKETFTVIGTLQAKEQASLVGGSDSGGISLMPLETAGEIANGINIMRILIKVDPELDVKTVIPKIETVMLTRHAKEDFTVLTQEDILGFLDTILNLLTTAIIAIAAISLVVAGIGIMNIMLVSVTERTREIGLRKAIGAPNSAILFQFLVEAVLLTFFGAVIALGLSYGATQVITQKTTLHPLITMDAIVLAVSVAVSVGIIFGLAPAVRAARLDPIKALRYE